MAKSKVEKQIIGYYVRFQGLYGVDGADPDKSPMEPYKTHAFRFKYRKDAVWWIEKRAEARERPLSDYRITRIVVTKKGA